MINIVPVDDIKEHIDSILCKCCPVVEFENGEMIIIHNSYDWREFKEALFNNIGQN